LVGLGVTAFIALLAMAMALYPGGTVFDRTTVGHRFWTNFFCDIQQPVAINGQPNKLGSWLGRSASTALYASWIPLWLLAPRVLAGPRTGRTVRLLGVTAAVLAFMVPFCPKHFVGVLIASTPGLAALTLTLVDILRRPCASPALRIVSTVFTLLSVATDSIYAVSVARGVRPFYLPGLQKVTAMALLAWMSAFVLEALRSPSVHSEHAAP
jgi:hypothetical protein